VGSLEDLGIQTAQPPPPPPPPPPPAPVTPPPAPAPPEEILPETLGRPEIRRGAESVKAAVLGCGQGQTGTVTVEFTVSGETGGVTNARVTGEFAGSAVGACAENAARRAAFARFRRPTFTFTFPFVLPIQ
jgi:outer membrane biosynthesis protein TonB